MEKSNLNTSNPNHYLYETKHLKISILGGIRFNNLEALRVTLGISKQKSEQVLRQNIDLYNDTSIEKLTRKVAERLEIGTTIVRRDLDQLTNELEQFRLQEVAEQGKLYEKQVKVLTEKEIKEAKEFLAQDNLLAKTNELIGLSGVIGEEFNRLLMYIILPQEKRAIHYT
ncbi:hypothetical protein [Flavobacterium columnare]|uniref:hypothetical protein n=1 Tax=Flavobacterium columnare TaxID=996 RepID=UPI002989DCF6|nr:hypothetical protein [Flavobacterium columnare]MCH4829719.1 hypothetical protein [Flavobacterium columnare]